MDKEQQERTEKQGEQYKITNKSRVFNVLVEEKSLPYPSAALLLECARDEYNKERERAHSLDNKASFFMTAIILVSTLFVPFVPFNRFYCILDCGTGFQKTMLHVMGTLLFVAFILLILAFRCFNNVFRLKNYKRFNIENLIDISILTAGKNMAEKGLCENYKVTIEHNIEIDDIKASCINHGISFCSIGFLLLMVTAIVLKCTIG